MGMGMVHKTMGALKSARFSCSNMTSTIIRVFSLKFVCYDAAIVPPGPGLRYTWDSIVRSLVGLGEIGTN